MRFPEGLWKPVPKDLMGAVAPIRLAHRSSVTQAATNLFEIPFTCGLDEAICVTNILVQGVPGAAQNVTLLRAGVADTLGNTIATIITKANAGAGLRDDMQWSGEVWLMPREHLILEAIFDVGAVANILGGGTFGFRLPRGNWQIG